MQKFSELVQALPLPTAEQEKIDQYMAMSYDEQQEMLCAVCNQAEGDLPGARCEKCHNKGLIFKVSGGEVVSAECKCMAARRSMRRIESSGLGEMLDVCTFDTYQALEPWQQQIKARAQEFVASPAGQWWYIGGQVGAGKTHICTAMVGELMNQGKAARYMLWRDEIVRIKACVNDDSEYFKMVNPLKTVEVLYIDDVFKTGPDLRDGQWVPKAPTAADVQVAFEILNYRYNRRDLITIFSGERSIDELIGIDEAVGSRIYERSKLYSLHIGKDSERNYRLRGSKYGQH